MCSYFFCQKKYVKESIQSLSLTKIFRDILCFRVEISKLEFKNLTPLDYGFEQQIIGLSTDIVANTSPLFEDGK